MTVLFISDVHLAAASPQAAAFFDFLHHPARQANQLFILGDLFDAWIGDDDPRPFARAVCAGLRSLADAGVAIKILHGNRDFLLGSAFAAQAGAQLLPEQTLIELAGQRVLLTHGDELCTDDTHYQQLRAQFRHPAYQQQLLALPLEQRYALAARLRNESESAKSYKSAASMDVNPSALQQLLQTHHYPWIIHGHTHQPAHHFWEFEQTPGQRWVLPDWHAEPRYLRVDGGQWHRVGF